MARNNNEPHVLMSGLAFGESPRWHDSRLWVSDWGTREIITVDGGGKSEVKVQLDFPSFQAICIDWLPDKRMLIGSSGDNRLLYREAEGPLKTYADLSRIPCTGWNEIVVDGRRNTYINGGGTFTAGENPAPGIIALVTPDGSARQVADGIVFPNGMAITPDDSTLIIADSRGRQLTAFDIASDGSLLNRRVWAELEDGYPDGICIDEDGAVWYADVPNKCCVHVREGGEVLERIELDRGCFACMLGGIDGKTLFMVAREWRGMESTTDGKRTGQVLTARAPAPGAGWP